MQGIVNYPMFLLAGILLNITPGADTIYILSRSVAGGRSAGILSTFGVSTGILVHTTLAALGLSVVLRESLFLFSLVKYTGAAYLVFLGARSLLQKKGEMFGLDRPGRQEASRWKLYFSGVLTNVLNPKVALFFLAFLPQFINPALPRPGSSFFLLGLTFTFTGTLWCLFIAVVASRVSRLLRESPSFSILLEKMAGAVFLALGVRVALSKS